MLILFSSFRVCQHLFLFYLKLISLFFVKKLLYRNTKQKETDRRFVGISLVSIVSTKKEICEFRFVSLSENKGFRILSQIIKEAIRSGMISWNTKVTGILLRIKKIRTKKRNSIPCHYKTKKELEFTMNHNETKSQNFRTDICRYENLQNCHFVCLFRQFLKQRHSHNFASFRSVSRKL